MTGKKAKLALICVIVAVFINLGCQKNKPRPIPNKPLGFRGLTWGASTSRMSGWSLVKQDGEHMVFTRDYEDLNIGRAEVTGIEYSFYKDRFYQAEVKFEQLMNYEALKKELFFRYGRGRPESSVWHFHWRWLTEDLEIELVYSQMMQSGDIRYTYLPLLEEMNSDILRRTRQGKGRL